MFYTVSLLHRLESKRVPSNIESQMFGISPLESFNSFLQISTFYRIYLSYDIVL